MLLLYALYALARPAGVETDLTDVFPSSVGSMLVVLLFAHTDDPALFLPFLVTVSANAAIALYLAVRPWRWLLLPASIVGAVVPTAVPLLLGREVPVAALTAGGLAGLVLFLALSKTRLVGRRLVASLVIALVAWFLV